MAARFDSGADVLSRSASGLGSTSVTMCAWVQIDVDLNTYGYFMGADDGGSYTLVGFSGDGTTLSFDTGSGYIGSATSFSVGGWYFVAGVYDSASTDWLYWAADGAGSLSSASGSVAGFSNGMTFRLGADSWGESVNGRVAYARVWTAALSSAELAAERASATAVRTSGLWADWPLAADADDVSGAARHLTPAGTVTYVAQPFSGGGGPTFVRPTIVAPVVAMNRASRW